MHRLLWATLLGAAAFLATSALAGLVQAHDGPAETLLLPAPASGDEALYSTRQIRFDDRWGAVPYVLRDAQMKWSGPTKATDVRGTDHETLALEVRAGYDWKNPAYSSDVYATHYYDTATRAVVHVAGNENMTDHIGGSSNVISGPAGTVQLGLPGGAEESLKWVRVATPQAWLGPCGLWSPLHGAALPLDQPVHLGGSCDDDQPTGDEFRYDGRDDVAGVQAYRFQHTQDPQVRLWYAPGIPFPVKMREHFSDFLRPEITHGWVFEWTLTGVRSSGASPAEPALLPPPLQAAPAPGGIPDETGASTAFPLATALAAAATDADFNSVLARPDGYLGFAWLEGTQDEVGRMTWTWSLLATNGNVWRAVQVSLPPADQRLAPVTGVVPLPPQPEVEPWSVDLPGSVQGIYPTKEQAASTFPRVADAFAAFERVTYQTGKHAPERWAVIHRCQDGCETVESLLTVGYLRNTEPDGVLPPQPSIMQSLRFAPDGTIAYNAELREYAVGEPIVDLAALHDPEPAANPAPAASATAWERPAPATLAVLGAASLAAGLALWLWPALKAASGSAGGFGLFSRTQDDQLLEHKGRAAIVGAITADPGVHLQQLSRRTGIAAGALRHHLRKLEAAGLVVTKPLGGYSCYFVPRQAEDKSLQANALSKSEGAQQVLAALQRGVTGVRAIAAATGLSPSTVSHHMARLRTAGLLPGEAGQAAA